MNQNDNIFPTALNQPELGDIDVVSLGEVLEGVIPEEQQIREGIRNSSAKNARTFSQTETDQAKISLQDRGIKKETYKDSLRKVNNIMFTISSIKLENSNRI